MTQPTFVFLHALGSSHREWDLVSRYLPDADCVALDLPGFGDRAEEGYADVVAMADDLADQIRRRRLTAVILVGHSMGGKIASIVAAWAAAGEIGLAGVIGIVLVTASPPEPEPMDEDRRARMIGWVAHGAISQADAETFVDANTAKPLPAPLRERAMADVRRSSPEAWLGWLERGSREDWGAQVGHLSIPALIVAGAADGDLDEAAQRRLNQPHYRHADIRVIAGAAHLIPYEQPEALAKLIADHAASLKPSILPEGFVTILGSDRVSRRTRAAMLERTRPVAGDALGWSQAERAIASALISHILPDDEPIPDLALRVEAAILHGPGDGWRFATLPPDADAWRQGFATLERLTGGFATLDHEAQADWLERIAAGSGGATEDGLLSPEQMALWFQDVRAEIVRQWASLPATMAAIGYDGFAVGGDGPRKQGYARTAADDVEAWQRPREATA
ncbi:alpha/beta hydrolase [Sphingomonas fuzhouensis]|uniref:alpha/beta hydrolase n=1 Tax=Sphingomonas fuzhouensis TaxID=3106033 RepID=UPI002AFDF8B9|nr:alpha/beta fold hydrolase [Sphingomonas sp. SGZ-02]